MGFSPGPPPVFFFLVGCVCFLVREFVVTVDVKALIAKQRELVSVVKVQSVEVPLGGERVTLTFERATADEWDGLVASNPPRHGVEGDALVGYNPKGVSRAYPRVLVGDVRLDAETWGELYDSLDSIWRNNVEVTLWGVNVNESLKELAELGKVLPGKR